MDETVYYEVTAEDFIALNLYHVRHSQAVRKKLKGIRVMTSGLAFVLPLLVYRAMYRNEALPWQAYAVALVCAGTFFALYPWLAVLDMRRQTRKFLTTARHVGMLGPQTLRMGPDGLTVSSETNQSMTPWPEVEQIVVTEEHIFFYIGNLRAYVVPRRAFADQSAEQAFLQLAERYHQPESQGNQVPVGG